VTTNYVINRDEIEEKYMRMNRCTFCDFKSFSLGNLTSESDVSLDRGDGIVVRPLAGTTYFTFSGEFTTPSCEKVFPTKPILNFKTTVCGNEVITEKDNTPFRIQMDVGEPKNVSHIAIQDLLSQFSNSDPGCGFDPTSLAFVKDKRNYPLEAADPFLSESISFNAKDNMITIENDLSVLATTSKTFYLTGCTIGAVCGHKQVVVNYQLVQNFAPIFDAFNLEDFVIYTNEKKSRVWESPKVVDIENNPFTFQFDGIPRWVSLGVQMDFFTLMVDPTKAKAGDYNVKITLNDVKATFPARSYYVKIKIIEPKNLAEFEAIDSNGDGFLSAKEI